MRRTLTLAVAAVAVASLLAACGYQGTKGALPSDVSGTPSQGGTTTPGTGGSGSSSGSTSGGSTSGGSTSGGSTSGGSTGGAAVGDAAAGKAVFESAGCSSCHTLKDAGATGTVGPNLDQVQPSAATVVGFVTNGGGPMPAFGKSGTLTPKQIADVAAYVSSVAGK